MALYARDILTGDLPGPYNDDDADRFARLALETDGCDRRGARTRADCAPRVAPIRRSRPGDHGGW